MSNPCKHWFEGMVARSETMCPFCEIERLKAALNKYSEDDIRLTRGEIMVSLNNQIERKDAALRVALVELRQYRLGGSTGDHHIQCAITTIKEALK